MAEFEGHGEGRIDPQIPDQHRGEGIEAVDGYVDHGIFRDQGDWSMPDDRSLPPLGPEYSGGAESDFPDLEAPGQKEQNWLLSCQAQLDRSPGNPFALRMRDDAAARYYRALAAARRDQVEFSRAASTSADLLDSPDVPPDIKEFLVVSAILIGVAILSGAGAGAVGAALVNEVASKEIVKGAVAGLVTSVATLATERVLARQAQLPDRSRPPAHHAAKLPADLKALDERGATPPTSFSAQFEPSTRNASLGGNNVAPNKPGESPTFSAL